MNDVGSFQIWKIYVLYSFQLFKNDHYIVMQVSIIKFQRVGRLIKSKKPSISFIVEI